METRKIAINVRFGGFGIVDKAERMLAKLLNIPIKDFWIDDVERDNPHLISVIEHFGIDSISGELAAVVIIEIPRDVKWSIHDYDGMEHIAEEHRIWP